MRRDNRNRVDDADQDRNQDGAKQLKLDEVDKEHGDTKTQRRNDIMQCISVIQPWYPGSVSTQ